jgi:hypothetical protein
MRRFGGPYKRLRPNPRADKLWVERAVGMSAATDLGERNPRSDRMGAEAHTVLLCEGPEFLFS